MPAAAPQLLPHPSQGLVTQGALVGCMKSENLAQPTLLVGSSMNDRREREENLKEKEREKSSLTEGQEQGNQLKQPQAQGNLAGVPAASPPPNTQGPHLLSVVREGKLLIAVSSFHQQSISQAESLSDLGEVIN